MKIFFFSNKVLQYYLPVSLILFNIITIKRVVVTDGSYDRLFGLPLAYISNNDGCTGCYQVYVLPLLFDVLTYLAVVFLIFKLIEKIGVRLKTHWVLSLIGTLLIIISIAASGILINPDSHFNLSNSNQYSITSSSFSIGNIY